MWVKLENKIKMAGDSEHSICETFEGKIKSKSDSVWISYRDSEDQSVVLRLDEKSLSMIRYSSPIASIKFFQGEDSLASYPDLGDLVVKTESFDRLNQGVEIHYQLVKGELVLGQYHLKISYGRDRN